MLFMQYIFMTFNGIHEMQSHAVFWLS